MRTLIRSPLTWAVVAEMAVVGALLAVAWNVVGSATHSGVAPPAAAATDNATADDSSPLPDIPSVTGQGALGPFPGLNVNSAFWRRELAQLNRDQAEFAQIEWRIVRAGMVAVRDYVEGVVLPAVRRAEGKVS
jgi:hypothetical protein